MHKLIEKKSFLYKQIELLRQAILTLSELILHTNDKLFIIGIINI